MQKYNNIEIHHALSVDGQGTLQHCVKSVERMSSSGLPPCLWLPTTTETGMGGGSRGRQSGTSSISRHMHVHLQLQGPGSSRPLSPTQYVCIFNLIIRLDQWKNGDLVPNKYTSGGK